MLFYAWSYVVLRKNVFFLTKCKSEKYYEKMKSGEWFCGFRAFSIIENAEFCIFVCESAVIRT